MPSENNPFVVAACLMTKYPIIVLNIERYINTF